MTAPWLSPDSALEGVLKSRAPSEEVDLRKAVVDAAVTVTIRNPKLVRCVSGDS